LTWWQAAGVGATGALGPGFYTLQFACPAASGKFLHIGVPIEFVKGEEGPCWGTATPGGVDPRTTFEAVAFPSEAQPGAVALKSLAASKFLRVGLPGNGASGPPWVIRAHDEDAPSPTLGRFVLTADSLFSPELNGYMNFVSSVVRFHSGRDPKERPSQKSEATTELRVARVSAATVDAARALKAHSDAVIANAVDKLSSALAREKGAGLGPNLGGPTRIALGTAMTSKLTRMTSVSESPFFQVDVRARARPSSTSFFAARTRAFSRSISRTHARTCARALLTHSLIRFSPHFTVR
jgi:hypothetical protein